VSGLSDLAGLWRRAAPFGGQLLGLGLKGQSEIEQLFIIGPHRTTDVITIKTATRLIIRGSAAERHASKQYGYESWGRSTIRSSCRLTTSSRVDGGAQPIASGSPNRITELIQKYIPDRKRPDAVEVVFGLPIELEGDDYVALARKVDAAVRAL
jgi:hypothetical protein